MYCKNCGNKLIDGAKFCGKCGNKVTVNDVGEHNASPETIKKYKKKIGNAGRAVAFVGWLLISVFTFIGVDALIGWVAVNGLSFEVLAWGSLLCVPLLTIGIVYIILGNRIKHSSDKYILTYINFLLTSMVVGVFFGATVGAITIILFIYLFSARSTWKKLLKDPTFSNSLVEPKRKIRTWAFALISVLFLVGYLEPSVILTSLSKAREKATNARNITQEWVRHEVPEDGFSVLVPASSKIELHQTNTTFTAKQGDTTYSVTKYVNTDPVTDVNQDDFLLKTMSEYTEGVEKAGGKIPEGNPTLLDVGDRKAILSTIEFGENSSLLVGMVVGREHYYTLTVTYNSSELTGANPSRFFKSFLIK